jgi:hypothetical protein
LYASQPDFAELLGKIGLVRAKVQARLTHMRLPAFVQDGETALAAGYASPSPVIFETLPSSLGRSPINIASSQSYSLHIVTPAVITESPNMKAIQAAFSFPETCR